MSPMPRPPADPPDLTAAAPAPGAGRRAVLRGLDGRIQLLHRQIRAAGPLGAAPVAHLWDDIDRLLELRHWLQTGADPA